MGNLTALKSDYCSADLMVGRWDEHWVVTTAAYLVLMTVPSLAVLKVVLKVVMTAHSMVAMLAVSRVCLMGYLRVDRLGRTMAGQKGSLSDAQMALPLVE